MHSREERTGKRKKNKRLKIKMSNGRMNGVSQEDIKCDSMRRGVLLQQLLE